MCKRSKLYYEQAPMEGEDRISQLPDEVLVKIISDLSLRQAGRTSVLSTRWKTLWMFYTGDLYFEDHVALSNASLESLEAAREKYTRWVNNVTNSHKHGQIHGFKVCFDLDDTYKTDLDSWIRFAMQKKSRGLDIVLKTIYKNEKASRYTFPEQVLSTYPSNTKLIRILRLGRVNVSRTVLEDVLLKCPSLVAISISESETLTGGLSVSGLDLLKFIEIQNCDKLEHIEISGVKLEVVVYAGPSTTSIRILQAPKLNCIQLGGDYCVKFSPAFPEVSRSFSQLDLLVLDYTASVICMGGIRLTNFPAVKMLSGLELRIPTCDHESLLSFIYVIKACPNLRSLVVSFAWDWNMPARRKVNKLKLGENQRFNYLKKVEFRHFAGFTADVELVTCILENAPNVDELEFWDPITEEAFISTDGPASLDDFYKGKRAARERARQLANTHSPNARLSVTC